MLTLHNLDVSIGDKTVLHDLDLEINSGEVHVIMGLNGTGKSTLLKAVAGSYEVETSGEIRLFDEPLSQLPAHERANRGIFMSFQNPVEIPGVNMLYFLKTALNAKRSYEGKEALDSAQFLKLLDSKLDLLGMDRKFLQRSVNEGFSGGEKKRSEVLQMLILEPQLLLLDEIDSGVDIDALKSIAEGINSLRSPERAIVMVTHYNRLLEYVKPDRIHLLNEGHIVKSSDASLAKQLEEQGYEQILNA